MADVGHSAVIPIDEPLGILCTWSCGICDLDHKILTDAVAVAVAEARPIQPGKREVLTGGPGRNWVALLLQGFDDLVGVKANSLTRATVMFPVVLAIPGHAIGAYEDALDGEFRNTAVRDIDLMDLRHADTLPAPPTSLILVSSPVRESPTQGWVATSRTPRG